MVSFQIQEDSLVQFFSIENAIAASFDHFYLIIESFNKTAGDSIIEISQNNSPVFIECFNEFVKTSQPTDFNAINPASHASSGHLRRDVSVKEIRELMLIMIGFF